MSPYVCAEVMEEGEVVGLLCWCGHGNVYASLAVCVRECACACVCM